MWQAKPAPGSKKPDPFVLCPVTGMKADVAPTPTLTGPPVGVAGKGARSLAALTPQVSVAAANSWMVHMVMSSHGSTLV